MSRVVDRAALVIEARDIIANGSKSFRSASALFDEKTRERAWLLYAWCRACDDLTDGQTLGHDMTVPNDPKSAHKRIVALTDKALAGEATGVAPFDALGIVAAECRIPRRAVTDHLDGFALDAKGWVPQTTDDLLRYCFHVAGAVGVMMALVMGVDPDD
ncbi:MAG: squalene/phytoene synthase family protein, partial [Sphingomicrobium sp.]